jgi:acylphosphatase
VEEVDRLVAWCRQGPPIARVSEVSVEERPASGDHGDFEITY